MPKSPPPSPPKLKRRLGETVRAGHDPEQLAKKSDTTQMAQQDLSRTQQEIPTNST